MAREGCHGITLEGDLCRRPSENNDRAMPCCWMHKSQFKTNAEVNA